MANKLSNELMEMQEHMIGQMAMMCSAELCLHGIVLSDEERGRLREAIREYVTRSIEIEAGMIRALEGGRYAAGTY